MTCIMTFLSYPILYDYVIFVTPCTLIIIMILERSLIQLWRRKFLSNHFRKNNLIFHDSLHAIMTSLRDPHNNTPLYGAFLNVVMTPKNLSS